MAIQLELGIKSDPIEYRYSFPWLFELMQELQVKHLQLGTWFELYHLPDEPFQQVREQADQHEISISSVFTAHRELGGFFRNEPGYEAVARKCFERLIEVGQILGAESVGSNPGAVLRDQMELKDVGNECYLKHFKELMHYAHEKNISWLTIEPMSCLAEPPTLPDEIEHYANVLHQYHLEYPGDTARPGYCVDIAHGYRDQANQVVYDHHQLFEATLPWLYELHFKNTDEFFGSTFGFQAHDRERGIVDPLAFVQKLIESEATLPHHKIICYLEIGGPKLGRDYSDGDLTNQLTESIQYLKGVLQKGLAEATN